MKRKILAAALLCIAAATPVMAQQAPGPWLIRARAVHLDSANGDTTGLGLAVNNKWLPEVDISYFVTPQISAELVLTIPQKHTVSSFGVPIGTLRHLPPTLTLQYRFLPDGPFQPYVGAGLNYTRFSSVNLPAGVTIDRSSFGAALQAGFDVPLSRNLSLNVDLKKVYIRTDVAVAGTGVGTFKVDPVLFGVGLGYRF